MNSIKNISGAKVLDDKSLKLLVGGTRTTIWQVNCHDGTAYNLNPDGQYTQQEIVGMCGGSLNYKGQEYYTIDDSVQG